jgi:PleD family two-component response regulator
MKARKILVADVAQADERMHAIFDGAELRFARTVEQALRMLAEGDCDLLLIGVHFDDSRMFDLLRSVRGEGRFARLPIVCVKSRRLGKVSIASQELETAVKALRADAFVDLSELDDDEAVRRSLRALL